MCLEKPWRPDLAAVLAALVLLTWMGGAAFAALAVRLMPPGDSATMAAMAISMVSFQGAALAWVHLFLSQHGTGWGEAFGLARRNYGRCALMVVAVMPLVIAGVFGLAKGSEVALEWAYDQTLWSWLKPEPQLAVKLLKEHWSPGVIALQGFAALVLAPVGEEVLFRGILYPLLRQRSRALAAAVTGVLFAGVHFYPVGFLPFAFLSLALVAVYEMTRNLFAPILLHSLFNTLNFVVIVARPKWAEQVFN